MRILRISLRNFRNYEHLDLAFDQARTIFLGENGAGKSTIIDAISWCLLGKCRGVNSKGEGQKDLIRNGAAEMEVTVELSGIGPITRAITTAGGATSSVKTEVILGRMNTTEGMLSAVLYSRAFFDLHHADAKALLMQALDVRVSRADLPGVALSPSHDSVDLNYLDSLYQNAYANRTAVKREAANCRVPEKPKVIPLTASVDELSASLKAHQDDLQKATWSHANADAAVANQEEAIARAAHLVGLVDTLTGSKIAHENMLAKHRGEVSSQKTLLAEAQALPADPVDTLQGKIREHEILISKLNTHDPDRGCVLSSAIPCLTRSTEFAGQVATLQTATKDLGARVQASNERQAKISAALEATRIAERDVAYHLGQVEDIGKHVAAAKLAVDTLKQLKSELSGLKKSAKEAAQEVTVKRAVVDRAVAGISAQIEYANALAAYTTAADRKTALDQLVVAAEAEVKLLGPTGIRVAVLKNAMAKFEPAINSALTAFGFCVTIQPEPWLVTVQNDSSEGHIRFDMLSKGQQLWTGLAFQLALAWVSGLDFLVIDDIEAVVGKNRQLLTAIVMTADISQILVAMALPVDAPAPAIDGLQVVRVDRVAAAV